MRMPAHGPTTVVGIPTAIGRATARTSWYQHVKAWWTTRTAARHAATLASLSTHWDAQREVVIPWRTDGAHSVAMLRYGLTI
jgi:hypothetical protein